MRNRVMFGTVLSCCLFLLGGLAVVAAQQADPGDGERSVTETDVPKAALATLKQLAGAAPIKEFAEEIEHGHKFYEGSWTGPNGNIDALVTESGDLVEIEEIIAADDVPTAVRTEAKKVADADGKVSFEKKTVVMYEIHYPKGGKGQEMILTPDGRKYHEQAGEDGEKDADEEHEDE